MLVQLVPLGALILVMGVAWTEEPRIAELARQMSLTWVARLPRLTLAPNPFDELARTSMAQVGQIASNHFAEQLVAATAPAKETRALGIG
jgi:hypothetical protein